MRKNIWQELYDYESRDLIERFIKRKHQRDTSARQISEISSNFIQAREFFSNAENSNLSITPLLLYYGVNSLSRGLVLLLDPTISESSLKPSHGLDTVNWRESIVRNDLSDLKVKINSGGFYELLTYTKNKSYFKHNSSGVNYKIHYPIPGLKSEISLIDLVKIIPDLNNEYNKWKNDDLPILKLSKIKFENNHYKFSVATSNLNIEKINKVLGHEKNTVININQNGNVFEIMIPESTFPQISQSINQDLFGIGDLVLSNIPNQLYLNSLSQIYCLSFYLGMLCRYFPNYWININRTSKGDSIYPLFLQSIKLIQDFPLLVHEFLEGPYKFEESDVADL